ncbi:MAG: hypothetical protein CVU13_01310 [Bacteroidetes bacterium HGW-Bacteroidetes-8]|jgi:hypothetical protein|nr:MAG: hypothetical protein CVU13_01310 [Bacteroidetes bacterium HGW-Bacteroidetes-8]
MDNKEINNESKTILEMKRYYQSTRVAQLLAKFAVQDITEIEKRELTSLLEESGLDIEELLKKFSKEDTDKLDIEAGKRVWEEVARNIYRPKYQFNRRLLRYAAVFAVTASLALGTYLLRTGSDNRGESIKLLANETILEYPTGESIVLKEKTDISAILQQTAILKESEPGKIVAEIYKIKVSSGSTHTITLEDGTIITLYPESELEFPSFFDGTERSVKLSGEGYFDVKRDTSRPFIVTAADAKITVLGTSFNLRAYNNESTVETALVSGKVMMNQTGLLPNQLAILNRGDQNISIENLDATIYRERAGGMFIFENRSLEEIMREFSLWFGFEYNFEDFGMKDKKFRFKLPRTSNFSRLMDLMEKTGELRFEVNDKTVIILPANR